MLVIRDQLVFLVPKDLLLFYLAVKSVRLNSTIIFGRRILLLSKSVRIWILNLFSFYNRFVWGNHFRYCGLIYAYCRLRLNYSWISFLKIFLVQITGIFYFKFGFKLGLSFIVSVNILKRLVFIIDLHFPLES